jgi:hypothetical protein
MTIPGMTEETAAAIVSAQQAGLSSSSLSGRDTPAWLVIEGIVSLETMRSIAPYLTARGDVYRAYVVGHFQGGGPVCRVEVVIDGSQTPPAVVFRRDLNDLGRGYSRSQLAGE